MAKSIKQEFINVLIEMVNKQPLNTITVKDITDRCGVSRQSFYYHFNGIYELLGYFYKTESDKILQQYQNKESLKDGFIHIMNWALTHKNILMSTYNSAERDSVENFMYRFIYPYIIKIVEEEAIHFNVSKAQCEFIAKFYTLSINAVYLDWIKHGMQEEPEKLVKNVSLLITDNFKHALINFDQING